MKEASNVSPDKVFDFVLKNKDKMSRVTLKYAVEKYPEKKRKEALHK